MTGTKTSAHQHGSTSSGDDLDGIADSRRRNSSVVTGWNDDNAGPR